MGFTFRPAAHDAFRRWDEREERRPSVHEGRPKISQRFREESPALVKKRCATRRRLLSSGYLFAG
jgi:hypothetical protein